MRSSITLATLTLCFASARATVAHADAEPGPGPSCQAIHAEINLNTGTITGNFGLNGTVAFAQDGAGTAPPTAPATSSVFSGVLTIATASGELLLRETGMSSSRTGNPRGSVLASWGEAIKGSQCFDGVTGDLFFAGRRIGTQFLVAVTGQLCRAR
jgi:hypothetical protein